MWRVCNSFNKHYPHPEEQSEALRREGSTQSATPTKGIIAYAYSRLRLYGSLR
jgi:hypothetical protein